MAKQSRGLSILFTLVLVSSVAIIALALTRPDPTTRNVLPGRADAAYAPAAFEGAPGEALAAAVASLPIALSYDYRDLDASLAAATATMTGAFAEKYTDVFDRRARPVALQREAVTEALVRGAGVVRAPEGKRVVIVVFIDQLQLQAKDLEPGGEPRTLNRVAVRVALARRAGEWKIDDIRPM